MGLTIDKKFVYTKEGSIVLSNKEKAELVNGIIKPLKRIYGANPLLYEGARKVLDQEATVILGEYEFFNKNYSE